MKFYQEITPDWQGEIPNHTYLLNDSRDRMIGYVSASDDQLVIFKSPIRFDSRYRKFRTVENRWGWVAPEKPAGDKTWTVTGSRGDEYTISLSDGYLSCSCSGFKFRGKCKHLEQIKNSVVK